MTGSAKKSQRTPTEKPRPHFEIRMGQTPSNRDFLSTLVGYLIEVHRRRESQERSSRH